MRLFIAAFSISAFVFPYSCSVDEPVKNHKDLGQSMMDMRIYQENLGDEIRAGNLENGRWLLEGIDSTIDIVAQTVKEHHRMKRPFSYYKEKWLDEPLSNLKHSFDNNDTANARKHYVILIDRCNKCHIDLEVEKHVKY